MPKPLQDRGFDLQRFLLAQTDTFASARAELNEGRKRSHWMWFVFPQMRGLGMSSAATFYGIVSIDEARAYLDHPVLGGRLAEATGAVLAHRDRSLHAIFGSPDDLKFCSSMTLFEHAFGDQPNDFSRAIERFCNGRRDQRTLDLIGA